MHVNWKGKEKKKKKEWIEYDDIYALYFINEWFISWQWKSKYACGGYWDVWVILPSFLLVIWSDKITLNGRFGVFEQLLSRDRGLATLMARLGVVQIWNNKDKLV